MFAPEMRGVGASAGTVTTWTGTTVITLTFSSLVAALGDAGTFWLFSALTAGGAFYSAFCVYETKGKTLDQITDHFKNSDDRTAQSIVTENGENVDSVVK